MKAELLRTYLPTETLGSLMVDGICMWKSMELPWKKNAHNISCIPEGTYKVFKEATSNGHQYPHFRVLNVPDRAGILIHKITYVKDLRGCIGIGKAFSDLNKDGVPDIIQSTIALNEMYEQMPDSFDLIIRKK